MNLKKTLLRTSLRRAVVACCAFVACCAALIALSSTFVQALETDTLTFPNSECAFAGTFEQDKSLEGISAPLRSAGVFYYHCQHGVIWSTNDPVTHTLVLQRTGSSYTIKDSESAKLKSRQGKFLAKLLNNLMGADSAAITQQFAVESLSENAMHYRLSPKKRSLKRAIELIEISLPENSEIDTEAVIIKIKDQNAQLTTIRSFRNEVFATDTSAETQCRSVNDMSTQSCTLLLGLE